jgi:PAS domain S-box-containing protein
VKVPVRDAAGNAYAICGMSVDITARKEAEDRLRESEQRFRIMADGLPLIVWVHGPHGEQQFVNTTFCEFFGVSPEEMDGDRWQSLMHPDDARGYASAFAAAVRDQCAFHEAVRVRRSDGAWRWLESWARPRFSESGQFLGMVGTSADITERKTAEQRLERSDAELRNAMRRNDQFVATLAHEMRTPLAVMRNALAIEAQPEAGQRDREAARDLLARQVAHLARLADDLFDVSRSRLGKLQLQMEPLDMRAIVGDALIGLRSAVEDARHTLVYDPPAVAARVLGDRLRLLQIVGNLLTNAIRYTPPGGDIGIWLTCAEQDVVLDVVDSGIGLREGDIEVIFEPFRRVGDTTERGGLGIGLALVKDLVELHRGSVGVASAGRGRGSRFTVRLPRME